MAVITSLNKWIKRLIVVSIVLPLFLFLFQWFTFESNLKQFKTTQEEKFKSLEEIQKNALIEFTLLKKNDSTVVVQLEEINNINERFDLLFNYVNNNINRAESLVDKDIDRLNLYLAIGIGFIGILGVFVPILVNLMSVQDLREKINEIPEKKTIDDALKNATEALEKSENLEGLSDKITNLTESYNEAVPAITTLILQNSIGRFFNITPYILTQLSRKKERLYFKELLESIRDGFQNCDHDENHTFENNEFLKSTIKDFRVYITSAKFQTTAFNQLIVTKFHELSDLLKKLAEANSKNESQVNLAVRDKIDEIITAFS